MAVSPTDVLSSLRKHPLFAALDDATFAEVIKLLRARRLREGETLFTVGDHDCNLYIVRSGKLALRIPDEHGRDPIRQFLEPGSIFNEHAFLTGHADEESVEALTRATLWFITREAFQDALQRNARLRAHIAALTPDHNRTLPRIARNQAQAGERVLWFGRRHELFFLGKIALPTLILAISLAGFLLLAAAQCPLGSALRLLSLILGFAALLALVWQVLDYYNDYFMVTDERVVHRERIVLLYNHREELRLDRVQHVDVERRNFLDSLFDLGDVLVTAQGSNTTLRLDHVRHPEALARLILDNVNTVRHKRSAGERARLRAELRAHLGIGHAPEAAPAPAPIVPPPPKHKQRLRAWLSRARQELLPRMQLVQGNTIFYRRHWLILLKGIAPPSAALLAALGTLVLSFTLAPSLLAALLTPPFSVIALVGLFLLAFWWVWRYEDWRNDVFILTPERVLYVKRTPFGLFGTSQRAADLRNVQNTTVTTRGFVDVLFNIGDVSIRTAGMENELLFDRVWNPAAIQAAINERVQQALARAQRQQAEQRYQEILEWLSLYDELTRLHTRPPLL